MVESADGTCRITDIEVPPPGQGQVTVRVKAAGVCRTDFSVANGTLPHRLPAVLGHEGAGVVTAVGKGVSEVRPGDPVILSWTPSCGSCPYCRRDQPYLCSTALAWSSSRRGRTTDGADLCAGLGVGAFAEHTVVPVSGVVPLPPGLPLQEAALLGCAVLTGFGAVQWTARVRQGESVVVIGVGGVGQSALQAARLAGADPIIAVDTDGSQEDVAHARGATHFRTGRGAVLREVLRLTERVGADHVLDCVGARDTIRLAWQLTRRGGVTTVVGIGSRSETVGFTAQELCTAGRSLLGCVYGNSVPRRDVPVLADHILAGRVDLTSMVGPRVGLADLPEVLRDPNSGRNGRVLVTI